MRQLLTRALAALAFCAITHSATATAAEPPNILLIFTDDQAFDAVHALGEPHLETPNLDRLVAEGTTFTRSYNSGAWHGAVCVASRTMLNTGRQLWNARAAEARLAEDYLAENRLWSQLMQRGGYRTYMTGKWHVKVDVTKAFDDARNVRPGMPRDSKRAYNRPLPNVPDTYDPTDKSQGGFWAGGKHWSEVVADDVQQFLAEHAGNESPFFIYAAFNAPHDPRQSPQEYLDKYPADDMSVPKSFVATNPWAEAMGCGPGLRDERLAPFPRTRHAVQVHRREYFGIISHLDAQVGRILDTLREQGLGENTVVIFTSDHGLAVGRHGLLGKQNMFEHSVRMPLVIAGPGFAAGRKIDAPVYMQDIMPTTLELAGAEVPEDVEFRSLLPLARDETTQSYDTITSAYTNRQRMIIVDGWKLIAYPTAGRLLLFNLQDDPQELNDLADDPNRRDRLQSLLVALVDHMQQAGDELTMPQDVAQWNINGDPAT